MLLALVAVAVAGDHDYASLDQRAMLGVHMSPPSPATQYINRTTPEVGVEVLQIYRDTAAERMGIEVGDLILTVNGGEIGMMGDLRNEVALTGVGGEVTVELLRDGRRMTMSETLGEWPEHIPQEPLDVEAERRFRAWQEERWQRLGDTADRFAGRIAVLEEQPWAAAGQRDPLGPEQVEALRRLPAFRLRLHTSYDTPDRRRDVGERRVAWEARVLIGTPAPPID
jgi:hypothetical protein